MCFGNVTPRMRRDAPTRRRILNKPQEGFFALARFGEEVRCPEDHVGMIVIIFHLRDQIAGLLRDNNMVRLQILRIHSETLSSK